MGGVRLAPSRGDIWEAEVGPGRGREQAGRRPALIISTDNFNRGPSELVTVIPLTSRDRGYRFHMPIQPPEGGLTVPSFAMCEQLRVFAVGRLFRWRGAVDPLTLAAIEYRLRVLLDL